MNMTDQVNTRNVINGQKVIERQTALFTTPLTNGRAVPVRTVEEVLLEDGTTVYQCAWVNEKGLNDCEFTQSTVRQIISHQQAHTNTRARGVAKRSQKNRSEHTQERTRMRALEIYKTSGTRIRQADIRKLFNPISTEDIKFLQDVAFQAIDEHIIAQKKTTTQSKTTHKDVPATPISDHDDVTDVKVSRNAMMSNDQIAYQLINLARTLADVASNLNSVARRVKMDEAPADLEEIQVKAAKWDKVKGLLGE